MIRNPRSSLRHAALLLLCASLLSAFTVIVQIRAVGRDYVTGEQMRRHRAILDGTANAPYQYRILSEYGLAAFLRAARALAVSEPEYWACFSMRLLQNLLIFGLAAWWYRASGFRLYLVLLGLALLAWGMSQALYNSDLAFNTYADVAGYFAAVLLIHSRRDVWLIPLMAAATLNRETCGLIPVLLLAVRFTEVRHQRPALLRLLSVAAASGMVYAGVFVGLRLWFGARPLAVPVGYAPGLGFVAYNLGRPITYIQLTATFSLLPLLAALAWRAWPASLKKLGWALVPAWLIIHLLYSVIAETRLLLVPFGLLVVPGVLHGLKNPRALHPDK